MLLSVTLFVFGIGFLILGWRWQSPQDTELLTALKGLVYFKRELERVQGNLERLEAKVACLPVSSVDSVAAVSDRMGEAVVSLQTARAYELPKPDNMGGGSLSQARLGFGVELGDRFRDQGANAVKLEEDLESEAQGLQGEPPLRSNKGIRAKALPQKYLEVLKLADSGLSLREIARELSLSQDAVGLVLRTYPRGGRI